MGAYKYICKLPPPPKKKERTLTQFRRFPSVLRLVRDKGCWLLLTATVCGLETWIMIVTICIETKERKHFFVIISFVLITGKCLETIAGSVSVRVGGWSALEAIGVGVIYWSLRRRIEGSDRWTATGECGSFHSPMATGLIAILHSSFPPPPSSPHHDGSIYRAVNRRAGLSHFLEIQKEFWTPRPRKGQRESLFSVVRLSD